MYLTFRGYRYACWQGCLVLECNDETLGNRLNVRIASTSGRDECYSCHDRHEYRCSPKYGCFIRIGYCRARLVCGYGANGFAQLHRIPL